MTTETLAAPELTAAPLTETSPTVEVSSVVTKPALAAVPEPTPSAVPAGTRYALTSGGVDKFPGTAVFSELPAGTYLVSVYFTKHTQRASVNGGTAKISIAEPQSNQVVGTGLYLLSVPGNLQVQADNGLLVICTPISQ